MLPSDIYSQPTALTPCSMSGRADIVRRHVGSCSAVTSIDETGGEARAYGLTTTSC